MLAPVDQLVKVRQIKTQVSLQICSGRFAILCIFTCIEFNFSHMKVRGTVPKWCLTLSHAPTFCDLLHLCIYAHRFPIDLFIRTRPNTETFGIMWFCALGRTSRCVSVKLTASVKIACRECPSNWTLPSPRPESVNLAQPKKERVFIEYV